MQIDLGLEAASLPLNNAFFISELAETRAWKKIVNHKHDLRGNLRAVDRVDDLVSFMDVFPFSAEI